MALTKIPSSLLDTTSGLSLSGDITLADNDKAIFGDGSDLQIYHDGSNSYIWDNGTGLLQLRTNGSRIEMVGQNGSEYMARFEQDGAVKLYYDNSQKIATSSTGIDVTGTATTDGVTINDSGVLRLNDDGTTDFFTIQQGGTSAVLTADSPDGAGNMIFRTATVGVDKDRMLISAIGDISFYDDTGTTAQMTWDASADALTFTDNTKATFGADSDLQIYHSGLGSYIQDTGTGSLSIRGTHLNLADAGGNIFIEMTDTGTGGTVEIKHETATKLTTTSTGIDVTGVLSATSISVGDSHTIGNDGFDNLEITSSTSENIVLKPAGSVYLYNAGAAKLVTTSTGIDVTGTISSGAITSTGRISTTNGLFQANEGNQKFRQYEIGSSQGTETFLLGKIENGANADGGVTGTVKAAYDYGETVNNCNIHFTFAQRSGAARGHWWYENTDDDASTDVVSVRLVDDGAGGMFVWLYVGDYVHCFVEAVWRQCSSVTDSGTLSAGTITTGTTLFDTANDPTSEHHIGKLFAHNDITVSGTVDGRDIATDGTKLDGIESGATADQTQSDINALGITATGLSGTPNITVGTVTASGVIKTDLIQREGDNLSSNSFLDFDMDTGASSGTNNVVLAGVNNVDFLIDTNNNSTAAAFVFGKDATTMSAGTQLMTLDESGHLDLKTGNLKINGTSVIDTSRNIYGAAVQATSFSDGTISGITFIDEDSFATNSATRIPTQQSIKAYVDAEVAGVVDSAPAALNTLNELAAALGDDASFSTTTSTALGNRLRVDTASQGLTGTQQANAITNLGITATKAELNYVDGVTSAIQTQLDTKLASSSYTAADVLTKIKTVDGASSGLDADLLDGQQGSYYLDYSNFTNTPGASANYYLDGITKSSNTLTFSVNGATNQTYTFGSNAFNSTTIPTNNNELTNGAGYITGLTFDNLTSKTSGTGEYSTSGYLTAGRGSGGVSLTHNDGYGNANVTFNHKAGVPEQNGNSARIEVNTDATSNASMNFEVKSNVTSGVAVGLTSVLNLAEGVAAVTGNITVTGTVDGRDVASDGSKLDGIESGATADQTAAEILTAIKTVDGAGSGLDADSLDGLAGSSYLRSNAADTFTTLSGTTLNLGSEVSLAESSHRADLLAITSSTSSWGGITIANSSGETLTSFMGQGNDFGIYDDINNDWAILCTENSEVRIFHNGAEKLATTSSGIDVVGNITLSGTVDGRDVATDGTKLDTIDTNADVTPSWVPSSNPSYLTGNQTITLTGDASGSGTTSIAVTVADNSHNHSSSSGDFTVNGGNVYTGTGQQRVKLGVWSNTTYGIGMQAGYTFGGITSEYVLTNQMSNTNGRGFWWGDNGHTNAQGAMALTTQGYLTVAERIRVGYGESDTTTPSKDLDVSGEGSIGSLMVGATTTPAQQLQVKDTTNYHGILVNGSNAPNVCFDRSTGTTPEWKVGISGNVGESFAISKGTANDDKLRINTSGYIEMPNQPCFGVAKNNGYQTDDAVFICDQATGTRNHNDGSHYNTSNGRFTAPVAGRYFFSFSVMTHDSGGVVQAWIALRRNGSIIQYNLQHKTGGYHTRFDMTYTIKLAANDYIEAYVGESGTSSGWRGSASEYDNFSGFLIG